MKLSCLELALVWRYSREHIARHWKRDVNHARGGLLVAFEILLDVHRTDTTGIDEERLLACRHIRNSSGVLACGLLWRSRRRIAK